MSEEGKKKRNSILDEQDRECFNANYQAKNPATFGYIIVHENSTENHDNQSEQGRRSYRKTVRTTWLSKNLKPRTVHHHTKKFESHCVFAFRHSFYSEINNGEPERGGLGWQE